MGGEDTIIYIYNVQSASFIKQLNGHKSPIYAL